MADTGTSRLLFADYVLYLTSISKNRLLTLDYIGGADLDGSVWGTVVSEGLSKPFLLFNTETHNRTSDETLAVFWRNLRGWKLELTIVGSVHGTFSDEAILYEYLRAEGLVPDLGDLYGTVGGNTMLGIENAYLDAFFDMCLKKKNPELLKGPNTAVKFWPS